MILVFISKFILRTAHFACTRKDGTDYIFQQKKKEKWRGIVHGYEGPLPQALTEITKNWVRLKWPEQYKPQ